MVYLYECCDVQPAVREARQILLIREVQGVTLLLARDWLIEIPRLIM